MRDAGLLAIAAIHLKGRENRRAEVRASVTCFLKGIASIVYVSPSLDFEPI